MQDVPIDIELAEPPVSPDKFIEELYTLVKSQCKRDEVYPDDFLYQAIPVQIHGTGETVWWFATTHPIVLMLQANNIVGVGRHFGPLGQIEIYPNSDVVMCRDSIVGMCNEFGFRVKLPGAERQGNLTPQ